MLDNIGKQFKNTWIFRGINMSFDRNGEFVVTGPNGSGKSTLMKLTCGYSSPTEGSVSYIRDNGNIDDSEWYKHISVCSPYMELIEDYTLSEMIDFHFKFKSPLPGTAIEKLPEVMMLDKAIHKPIGSFSSGMMQRLKLGLTLFSEADLVLLDEPAMNLDKQGVEWYKEILQNQSNDRMFLIFTNHPEIESTNSNVVLDLTAFK